VVELYCRSIKANDIISLKDQYREAKIIIKECFTVNTFHNIVGNFVIIAELGNIIAVNIECKSLDCNLIDAESVICKNLKCFKIKAHTIKADILFTNTIPEVTSNYCQVMMLRSGIGLSGDNKKAILSYVNEY
jgi:hypothetical protein